ncbi:uncharacterized protein VTP21DRAFT_933 [Calcarisporiella thermophila]|uniref:uncharacterized protein n=1 Tax=Calcarisporiella thermophila TaxID=911321 RepID=UPI0037422745
MSRTHTSVALGGEVYQHIAGPLNTQVLNPRNLVLGDLPEAPRTVRNAAQIVFDSVLWQIHRDRIAYHFECTRASPETILVRAKMDIEEAIGAELIKARKKTRDRVIPKKVVHSGSDVLGLYDDVYELLRSLPQ